MLRKVTENKGGVRSTPPLFSGQLCICVRKRSVITLIFKIMLSNYRHAPDVILSDRRERRISALFEKLLCNRRFPSARTQGGLRRFASQNDMKKECILNYRTLSYKSWNSQEGMYPLKDYQFKLEFAVRDYECDLAGMVNNASYLNYLEHARHEFLRSKGIDFAGLAQQGIYLVVFRMELDYLYSLRSGDRFTVGTDIERVSRLRFGFQQDVYRLPDEKPVLKGKVIGTAVNAKGKPVLPRELEAILVNE